MVAATSIVLIIAGAVLCVLLTRLVKGGRFLLGVLIASYLLRVALAVGLYVVSAYQLPVFSSLQLPGGFWRFTLDAGSYHANGREIAEAFRAGAELPQIMAGGGPFVVDNYDFFYFVGVVYWIFGAHPLYVPLINCVLWIAIPVLGYVLARRFNGETGGRFAAGLIAFWPSTFIWSSQILKETVVIFLLLLSLLILLRSWEERRWVVLPALLPVVYFLTRFRGYVAFTMVLAAVLSMGLALATRRRELSRGTAAQAVAVTGLLGISFFSGLAVDPLWLFLRAAPERRAVESAPPAGEDNRLLAGEQKPQATFKPAAPHVTTDMQKVLILVSGPGKALQLIETMRKGFVSDGGGASFGAAVDVRSVWDLAVYFPKGLAYAAYAPFPWQWFSPAGDTGAFKMLSGIETVLIVAATPLLLAGIVRAVRSGRADAWILVLFSAITISALALVVTNYGILFRLRLSALIPLLALLSFDDLYVYQGRRLFAFLRRFREGKLL